MSLNLSIKRLFIPITLVSRSVVTFGFLKNGIIIRPHYQCKKKGLLVGIFKGNTDFAFDIFTLRSGACVSCKASCACARQRD